MASTLPMAVNRGYDVNWLDDYPSKVKALTLERVNGAIRKDPNPNQMFLVIAGTLP